MNGPAITGPKGGRRVPFRLLLFGVVAVAAFALGFLTFDVNRSRILVERYGYYTISLTFAWALVACWRVRAAASAASAGVTRCELIQAAGLALMCAVIAVLTIPWGYKVLYDEMVLQATASNMHLYREVSTVMRAYTVDGVFAPLDSYLDKRPFFFAYLVSLLHDLTGYREANAFALNIGLLPAVLVQVYLIARRFASHGAALAALLSFGTLSTLLHSSTGSGMETLNVAMMLLTVQLGLCYLDAPDAPRLSALVLSAILLAQTRYESSLFVVSVAAVALEGWRRAGRIIMPPAAIAAPALLIPYAVHNTYLSGTPLLWELHDNAQSRFSGANLISNLGHAWTYFFNLRDNITNSFWLSVAGFASLGYGAYVLVRNRGRWGRLPPAAFVGLMFFGAVVANLGLLMFYYWGQLDDPTVARLALPFSAMLALAIAFAVARLDRGGQGWWRYAAAGAVLAYFGNGLIANAQHSRLNTLEREIEWEREYVAGRAPGDRLMLTNKSALPWMISRIPAIAIDRARRRVDALRFQLSNHTFREILVFQTYRPTNAAGDFQIEPKDRLPDWFVLEPMIERRFGTRLDRISRLIEIRPEPPPAK